MAATPRRNSPVRLARTCAIPRLNGLPGIGVRAPVVWSIEKAATPLEGDSWPTYKILPLASTVMMSAATTPVVKGDPAVSVKAPVVALIRKTHISPLASLPTNRNRPCGSLHAPSVVPPDPVAVNGLPGMAVSAPLLRSILNPSTFEFPAGTYTYFLVTSMTSAKPAEIVAAAYPVKGPKDGPPVPAAC